MTTKPCGKSKLPLILAISFDNIPFVEPFTFENDWGNVFKKWIEWKDDFKL